MPEGTTAGERSRHLDWDGCLNLRDLGGLPTEDGRTTAWGAFVRGDTLCGLSDAGRGSVVGYGIRTVVDQEHGTTRADIDRVVDRTRGAGAGVSGAAGSL